MLCASSLLFIAALEIALRLRGYGIVGARKGDVVYHRTGEFEHDAVLNNLDLRDSEIHTKEPMEVRILILGDSFTYGLGVDEEKTFVRRTERLLRDNLRADGRQGSIRVVNAGVGSGPFREAEWLRDVGVALKPDLIVLGFFIGNDLYDDIAARSGGGADPHRRESRGGGRLRDFLRGSKALDWLWSRVVRLRAIDRFLFQRGLRRNESALYLIEQPDLEREAWRLTLGKIKEIDALARGHDAGLLVLIIPTSEQVRYGQDACGPGQDFELPNRILRDFLSREGIEYVDLMPLMRADAKRDGYYYVRDLHWTADGHRFASEVLAARIWSWITSGSAMSVIPRSADSARPQ